MKNVTKTQVVSTTHQIALNGGDILKLLNLDGHSVPSNASIDITIPGGGDWSGTTLDIDEFASPVMVRWTTREEINEDT